MFIRSQNKEMLINANNIRIISDSRSYDIICDFYDGELYYLGEYSTKEKAMKVMYSIQDQIGFLEMLKLRVFTSVNGTDQFIFQMPEDEEVWWLKNHTMSV